MSISNELNENQEEEETFLSVFVNQLQEYEDIYNNKDIKQDSPFSLYEDIQLLVKLSQKDDASFETFVDLFKMKILKRTAQEMNNRYQLCLRYIQQDDLQKLVDHVKAQGLQGYLRFEGEDNNKHIQFDQELPNMVEDASEEEIITKREIQITQQQKIVEEKKQTPSNNKIQKINQTIDEGEQIVQKKIKTEQVNQTEPQILQPAEVASQKQLKYILNLLSHWTKTSTGKLLKDLYKCSGDLETLTSYLQTGDQEYTWNKEEDELLISVQNDKTKKEIVERLFRERKGELFLNERKSFLNIK